VNDLFGVRGAASEERAGALGGVYLLEKISPTRSNLLLAVNYYYRERC
jgi:hypothetical protein